MDVHNVNTDNNYNKVFEGLLQRTKRYDQTADIALLRKAFNYSYHAHNNQVRESGTPYFEHPLEVAKILTGLKMDYETIAGGILHDVVEDTNIDINDLKREFGNNIAQLVDGVTKISELKLLGFETQQAENFRKMLLSMVKDIRVILIKFADRLHNMRTIEFLPDDKKKRIALETREVYAPLAHRLGLARIKSELEDLSLKTLETESYQDLAKRIQSSKRERESAIRRITKPIRKALAEANIRARFEGRAKDFYSIYNKINKRGVAFEEIYDLLAIRIIVEKLEECYHALGIVHSLYNPLHERFKDYIATPKSNGYQSIHTTVMGPDGRKFEIQIRTELMHRTAEEGIAAHWRYKEGKLRDDDFDKHLVWLRQVLEFDDQEPDKSSFMEHLKINLFQDEVFAFTPKGDLHRLPLHSTTVDFAFTVHTDVGLHCLAAKVNGRIVPLSYELKNGDTVEIITSANQRPNEDWLKFVISSKARSKIKKWLRDSKFESSVTLGEEMLSKALNKFSIKLKNIDMADLAQKMKTKDEKDFLASIGRGDIKIESILRRILPEDKKEQSEQNVFSRFIDKARKSSRGIRVAGIDNVMITFGKCCNPVPGEPITGIVTRGKGIVVHTNTCSNLYKLMQTPDRIVEVSWDVDKNNRFFAGLYILGERKNNLLPNLSDTITKADCNINSIKMTAEDSLVTFILSIEVYDLDHLKRVVTRINKIDGVISVNRFNE